MMEASGEVKTAPYPGYRTLWIWLALGWVASGVDRTITGPIMSYIIDSKAPILQGVENPFAVGGLVGSLLFAGYMLMQFPGGYVGDRLGHRTVIVISIIWAGVATILSGLMTALLGLVAMRVITGLGAGLFYSNDRSVITHQTPFEKRSLGMGFVITGLSIGITLAFLLAAPLIGLGSSVFGAGGAWRMPFIILGIGAIIVGVGMAIFFRGQRGEHEFRPAYPAALRRLGAYAAVFFVAVVGIYFVATLAGLPEWAVALLELVVALLLVGFIFVRLSGEVSPVLYNRDLLLIYIAAIAILWNLWFFGFWSVSIISDAAHSSFLQGALTAAFNAGAGILGFPAGGWLADYAKRKGWGRKRMLVLFTLIQGLLTIGFGFYIMNGGKSLLVLGVLLFTASLFFNALQPMSHALTADLVPSAAYLGAAFGLWNLIGEMGAVLSPAISGTLRDATGNWNGAVMLDGAIILISFVLLLFVREPRREREEPVPAGARLGGEPG
ncbi:MAG TPA: MFS transporter [Rubrobacteraceae bacterium]|nr:MFS transporter [Rubrobacteraceae bacterium]